MLKYKFSTLESSKKCNVGNFSANFNAFVIDFQDYQKFFAKILISVK